MAATNEQEKGGIYRPFLLPDFSSARRREGAYARVHHKIHTTLCAKRIYL